MALTLSKVMTRTWRDIGHLTDIIATGGSTTTVVDSATRFTANDSLKYGTVIVTKDSAGAGAAPEGEFSQISAFVASTFTFTMGALSSGVAAGDGIGLAKPTIPVQQMKKAVNDGLANLGTISLVDTSLTTVAGQTEYALPVGLKIKKLIDVLVPFNLYTNTTDNNYFQSIKGLIRDFPTAPAATGLLVFESEYISGLTIKIIYEGIHPELTTFSSVISETIQEELAVAAAREKALNWLIAKRGAGATPDLRDEYNKAAQNLQAQKFEKPVFRQKTKAKFFMSGM
jgi:hypothetical protein